MRFPLSPLLIVSWLSAACGGEVETVECLPSTTYPYSGYWQPINSETARLCLDQARPDFVRGTFGGAEVIGVVNRDGTLYLVDGQSPPALRAFTLSTDTLTQTILATRSGYQTRTLRWVRSSDDKVQE